MESAKNVALSWKAVGVAKEGVQELSLIAKADGTMRSLPMQIGFDLLACQVLSVEEGRYFKRDGTNTTFSHSLDAQKGRIFVTTTRNDVLGAPAGEYTVLTIKLRALNGSPADLKVLSAEPIVANGERPAVLVPPPWGFATTAAVQ
jgi:general secretion pathway protein D